MRNQDNTNTPPTPEKVDEQIKIRQEGTHPFIELSKMPDEKRVPFCIDIAKKQFKGYPDEVHQAIGNYYGLTSSKMGALEPVYRNPFKYLFQAFHPFYEPGRLLDI